jgi:hypothetical protein
MSRQFAASTGCFAFSAIKAFFEARRLKTISKQRAATKCCCSDVTAASGEPQKSRECGPRHEKGGGGICPMTACTATPKPSNLLSFPGNASISSPTGNP